MTPGNAGLPPGISESGQEPAAPGVRPGYKQTEVGVIPEDWEVADFGKLFAITAGGDMDPTRSATERDDTHRYPIYSNALTNAGLYGYCSYADHPADSITVTARGMVGHATYRSEPYTAIGRVLVLESKAPSDCRYFVEVTNTRVRFANESTGVPQLTAPQISRYKIPVPPLPEQRAIAEALSDVDGLLGALERLIAKKRDLKQAAMQQLLTAQTRLPGFSGEWVAKTLGDVVANIVGGGTPSRSNPAFWGDEVPWVTVKDFATFTPRESQESITRLGLKNSASHLIPAGTLITSTRMALGKAVVYEVDVAINQDLKALFLKPSVDRLFVYYWFESNAKVIDDLGSGSTVKGISISQLKSIPFPGTPLPEQTAIAAVLSDMDAELATLEQRREKTRALKQAMMQDLLTGRTRLVTPTTANVIPVDFAASSPAPTPVATASAAPAEKNHNWAINEAVVLSVLVKHFGSEKFPLGRKRCTKLSYLLHRHVEHVAEGYLKKAAGPYNPAVKYRGPESIAQKNGYIRPHKNGTYSGFVAAEKVAQAEHYFAEWYGPDVLRWLEQFRFKSNDDLERLATVDMAMEELRRAGQAVTPAGVRDLIAAEPEWVPKLDRAAFADALIESAIANCRQLFA